MRARLVAALCALGIVAGSCGVDPGVGLPACETRVRDPSTASILSAQAVPTARYTPCIEALPLGWDHVVFSAEDGAASLSVSRFGGRFISVDVAQSCDIGAAVAVDSAVPDIKSFEAVSFQQPEVRLVMVPLAKSALEYARGLAVDLAGVEINDRRVVISVDGSLDHTVGSRIDVALAGGDYVWIIDELDVEEGTLELRGTAGDLEARGMTVSEAIDEMEDTLPAVFYRGNWYFLFDGGCITYDFSATGRVAESIARDARVAFGFYPAYELRDIAASQGFNVGPPD